MLTNQLTIGLQSAFQAIGKIKVYQSLVGSVLLLNLPLAYLLLKIGFPVYSVLVSYIAIEGMACILRIILLKLIAGLSIREYLNKVLGKEVIPVLVSIAVCLFSTQLLVMPYRFLVTGLFSAIFFAITIYFFGLCIDERKLVNQLFQKVIKKINR